MSLFPLGILSAAGAGGAVASDYELIETYILGSSQSSITFSSLGTYSSTYKHLQIRAVARSVRAATDDQITLKLNGDSGSNYSWIRLLGTDSAVSTTSAQNVSTPQLGAIPADTSTASMFGALVVDFLDAYSTTKNKSVRSLNGFAGAWIALHSILYSSTSSLTSIEVIGQNGNLAIGTRVSLYGLKG